MLTFLLKKHLPSKSPSLSLSLSLLAPYSQGWCVITVQLTDEAADDEGVDYFLLFAGSTQRHLTSTLRTNHDTLHALCPGKPNHPQIPAALTSAAERHVGKLLQLQRSAHVGTWLLLCSKTHRHSPFQLLMFPLVQSRTNNSAKRVLICWKRHIQACIHNLQQKYSGWLSCPDSYFAESLTCIGLGGWNEYLAGSECEWF